MSLSSCGARAVSDVEVLIDEKFRTEPFHNLRLLWGDEAPSTLSGGTCSDKTLSFVDAARGAGFDARLHSGFIGGSEIHRLARLEIEGRRFFADVGNGWPAMRLYPADRAVTFRAFGMTYRTEISTDRVRVYHERRGSESLQVEIDIASRPESEVRAQIDARFNSGVVYPFSNSLRFSLVVGSRFLFLRGDRLEIYHDDGFELVGGIDPASVPRVLRDYFGVDLGARPGELPIRYQD